MSRSIAAILGLCFLCSPVAAEPYLEQPIVAEITAEFRARMGSETCRPFFRLYSTDLRNWDRRGDSARAEVAFHVEYISPVRLHGTAPVAVECLRRPVGDGFFEKGKIYRSAVLVYALTRWTAGWHIDRIEPAVGESEAGNPSDLEDGHPPPIHLHESPGSAIDLYNRGLRHFVERDYDKAIDDYTAAIAIDPRMGAAYNNRCLTLAVAKRNTRQALSDCDEAARLLPNRVDIPETRGLVQLLLGEPAKAIVAFDTALSMSPGKSVALYGRGIARQRLGDSVGGMADKIAGEQAHPGVQRTLESYGIH